MPWHISFSDSVNGILLASNMRRTYCFVTHDGGHTWDSTSRAGASSSETRFHSFWAVEPGFALLPDRNGDFVIENDTLRFRPGVDNRTFDMQWSSWQVGSRLVSRYKNSQLAPTVLFEKSEDNWQTAAQVDTIFSAPGSTHDALIEDSSHYWLDYWLNSQLPNRLYYTSDHGDSWTDVSPLDSAECPYCQWTPVRAGAAIVVRSPYSYFVTTNHGETWYNDSTFGTRLFSFAAPSSTQFWAAVGKGSPGVNYALPYSGFADTLAYSSDAGRTWKFDSRTFIGDTLVELFWLDTRHGWLTSWRDSTLYVYRYEAPSDAVPSETSTGQLPPFPNPAIKVVSFNGRLLRSARVLTVTGEEMPLTIVDDDTIDVHAYPAGTYFLFDPKLGGSVKFIVR